MKSGICRFARETRNITEVSGFSLVSNRTFRSLAFLLVLITTACSGSENNTGEPDHIRILDDIPDHVLELENLKAHSILDQEADTVVLTRQTIFESGEDLFMSGNIFNFTVDGQGRVYIVSGRPGNLGVYLFNADGSYLRTIGSYGQGPGEFEAIGSLDILDNELILLDPRLQKFAIYSLDSFEKTREEIINLTEATRASQISAIARGTDLVLLENGKMVLEVGMSSLNEEMDGRHIYYYLLERCGTVNPAKLLKVDRHVRYFLPEREGWAIPITKPFNRSSLVSITRSGTFLTAWTEDFLIKT